MDIKNISFIGDDERIKLNPSILKFNDMYIISYRISAINDKTIRYNLNLNNADGIKFNDIYNAKNIANPDIVEKKPFKYVPIPPIRDVAIGKIGVLGHNAISHTSDIYFNNFHDIDTKADEMKKIANDLIIHPVKSQYYTEFNPKPFISPEFVPVNVFQDDTCPVIPNKQITEGFTRIILCDLNYNPIPGYKLDLFGLDARLFNDCDDKLNIDKFYVYSVYLAEQPINFIYEITFTDLGFIITNIYRIPEKKFVKNIVFIKNNDILTGLELHDSKKINFNLPLKPSNPYNHYMHLNDVLLYNYISFSNYTHISIIFYSEIEKIKNNNKRYDNDRFIKIYTDTKKNQDIIFPVLIDNILKIEPLKIQNIMEPHIVNNWFGSSALTCVKNIHTGVNEYYALAHTKIIPTNVVDHEILNGRKVTRESTSVISQYLCENINPQYKLCTSNIPLKGYSTSRITENDTIFDLPENYHYYINKINSVKHFYDIITENIKEEQKINSFFMYLRDKLFTNRHTTSPFMYYNFILKFDNEFNIIDITNPFIFTGCSATGINFSCGLIIENNNFVIPFSVDDSISYIVRIPVDSIQFYRNIKSFDIFDMKFIDNRGMLNISNIIDILPNISDEEKRTIKIIYNLFIEKKIQQITNTNSRELHLIAKYIYKLTEEIDDDIDARINPEYMRNPYGLYISPLKQLLFQYIATLTPNMNILKDMGLENGLLQNGGYLQKYLKYKRKYLKLKSEIKK